MSLPYLTSDLPGTGGRLRATDDDFIVEEVPAYPALGIGDHTYLLVEKRGIATHEAISRIARALGRRPRDIGYAGLKDAHAVAVQTFSVEHFPIDRAKDALIGVVGVRLLDAKLHKNKLKLGHLRGNRFRVRIRDVGGGATSDGSAHSAANSAADPATRAADAERRARAILDVLAAQGSPNWFGEQRFGAREDNDAVGRLIVLGQMDAACDALIGPGAVPDRDERVVAARALYAAGDLQGAAAAFPHGHRNERGMLDALLRGRSKTQAVLTIPRPVLRLIVSAYQSALFNRLLGERLPHLGTLETGDLAFLHDKGAVFQVVDAAQEQPRADAFEISPSGPLLGTRTLLASGRPGERERKVLDDEGLRPEMFDIPGIGDFDGERRPFRIPVRDVEVATAPPDATGDAAPALIVSFELPRGAYATAVLREIMKA